MSFLYNKKTFLNSMNSFLETLNKRRQCIPYPCTSLYMYICNNGCPIVISP